MSTRYRSRTERQKNLQTGEWAEKHNLFHELLPYGYRVHNPIEILAALRSEFESMGEYQQLWASKDVSIDLRCSFNPRNKIRILAFAGAWPVLAERVGNPHSYANPLYAHDTYPAVGDSQRDTLIQETYDIPYWTSQKLATALNLSEQYVRTLRHNIMGRMDKQRHDMTKWARTMKTLNHWGYTYPELAKSFPYSKRALHGHVYRNADDFEPPDNPYSLPV